MVPYLRFTSMCFIKKDVKEEDARIILLLPVITVAAKCIVNKVRVFAPIISDHLV